MGIQTVNRYTKKVLNNADIRERHFKTRHHYDPTRKEGIRTMNIDVSRGLKMSIYGNSGLSFIQYEKGC